MLRQQLIQLEQFAQQWQPNFDSNLVSEAIIECVKKGQQRLRQEFDYRRQMLALNVHDHHLLQKFYQLQLDHEHVSSNTILLKQTGVKNTSIYHFVL